MIIDRYREATIALAIGDSVPHSVSDLIVMAFGFWRRGACRYGQRRRVALLELVPLIAIATI